MAFFLVYQRHKGSDGQLIGASWKTFWKSKRLFLYQRLINLHTRCCGIISTNFTFTRQLNQSSGHPDELYRSFTRRHRQARMDSDKLHKIDRFIEQKQVLFVLLQFRARGDSLLHGHSSRGRATYLMGLRAIVGRASIREFHGSHASSLSFLPRGSLFGVIKQSLLRIIWFIMATSLSRFRDYHGLISSLPGQRPQLIISSLACFSSLFLLFFVSVCRNWVASFFPSPLPHQDCPSPVLCVWFFIHRPTLKTYL